MIKLEFNQLGFALIVLLLIVILLLSGVLDLDIHLGKSLRQWRAPQADWRSTTLMPYATTMMPYNVMPAYSGTPHDIWSYTDVASGVAGGHR